MEKRGFIRLWCWDVIRFKVRGRNKIKDKSHKEKQGKRKKEKGKAWGAGHGANEVSDLLLNPSSYIIKDA